MSLLRGLGKHLTPAMGTPGLAKPHLPLGQGLRSAASAAALRRGVAELLPRQSPPSAHEGPPSTHPVPNLQYYCYYYFYCCYCCYYYCYYTTNR